FGALVAGDTLYRLAQARQSNQAERHQHGQNHNRSFEPSRHAATSLLLRRLDEMLPLREPRRRPGPAPSYRAERDRAGSRSKFRWQLPEPQPFAIAEPPLPWVSPPSLESAAPSESGLVLPACG